MKALKYLWHNHRLLLVGFSVATLVTGFFLVRFVAVFIYWQTHQDVEIERWMPIRYIARSYHVNRTWLLKQTGLPEGEYRPRLTIRRAANAAGIPYEEMRARLLAAIEERRAE